MHYLGKFNQYDLKFLSWMANPSLRQGCILSFNLFASLRHITYNL